MRVLFSFRVCLIVVLTIGNSMTSPALPLPRITPIILDEMIIALEAGQWNNIRFLRFDFQVNGNDRVTLRRHLWDRWTNRYRLEWTEDNGKKVVVLFNTDTKEGLACLNGKLEDRKVQEKLIKIAYKYHINDTYWLLAPFKLQDPGVLVSVAGEDEIDGVVHDILHVSFDHVGLTPGDHYWWFIDRETRRVDRWAFFLESFKGTPSLEKASAWSWSGWENVGGVWLARERIELKGKKRISFPHLSVMKKMPDKVFQKPQAPMPGS